MAPGKLSADRQLPRLIRSDRDLLFPDQPEQHRTFARRDPEFDVGGAVPSAAEMFGLLASNLLSAQRLHIRNGRHHDVLAIGLQNQIDSAAPQTAVREGILREVVNVTRRGRVRVHPPVAKQPRDRLAVRNAGQLAGGFFRTADIESADPRVLHLKLINRPGAGRLNAVELPLALGLDFEPGRRLQERRHPRQQAVQFADRRRNRQSLIRRGNWFLTGCGLPKTSQDENRKQCLANHRGAIPWGSKMRFEQHNTGSRRLPPSSTVSTGRPAGKVDRRVDRSVPIAVN